MFILNDFSASKKTKEEELVEVEDFEIIDTEIVEDCVEVD